MVKSDPTRRYGMNKKVFPGLLALVAHVIGKINHLLHGDQIISAGGWICVIDTHTDPHGEVILHRRVGTVPTDQDVRYRLRSLQSAWHLMSYPEHRTLSQASRGTHNDNSGAIRVESGIIAFAGLPAAWNEVLVLFAAWEHHATGSSVFREVPPQVRDDHERLRKALG